MCDGNHDCPQTNKSAGGEDEDNCGASADGNNSQFVAYSVEVALGCRASAIIYKNTRVYGDYPLIIAINASTQQLPPLIFSLFKFIIH